MKSLWKSYSRQVRWTYSSCIWCRDWEIIPSSVNKADQSWTLLTAGLTPLSSTVCCPCAWKCCFYSCTLGGRPGSSAPTQDNINTLKRTVPATEQSRNVTRTDQSTLARLTMLVQPPSHSMWTQTLLGKVLPLCCSSTELSTSPWVKKHQPILILYHSL